MSQFIPFWFVNDRFSMCCWDFFLLLGDSCWSHWGVAAVPKPMAHEPRCQTGRGREGVERSNAQRACVKVPFRLSPLPWPVLCCINSFPAGDSREAEEEVALALTVSGSSGPASPPHCKINPFWYRTHGCSGSLAQDTHRAIDLPVRHQQFSAASDSHTTPSGWWEMLLPFGEFGKNKGS